MALLDWDYWRSRGEAEWWGGVLAGAEDAREDRELRRATYAGAPLGPGEFVRQMEERFGRHWRQKGRPKKAAGREEIEMELCNLLRDRAHRRLLASIAAILKYWGDCQ